MDDLVICTTMDGGTHAVQREKCVIRPSVYGIVVSDGKVLMTKMRSTGKWWLPGGGIDKGETFKDALKRETWEECGVEIEVGDPLFFKENFFYYAPEDAAWQAYLFFFRCMPRSTDVSCHDDHDESVEPQWVEISTLRAEDLQMFGDEVMDAITTFGKT